MIPRLFAVPVWCLAAAALAVPLIVAPGLLASPLDLPKRLALEALAVAAWASWFARGGTLKAAHRHPAAAPALAFTAAAAASALTAVNPALGLEAAGVLVAAVALGLLVPAAASAPADRERVVTALLAAGGVEALYGILQYAGIEFLPWDSSWGSRCFGTVGNPVFFAELLAPVFVLATARWLGEEDEERKDLLALLVLLAFLALLFSQTRSACLGALAGTGIAAWCLWRRVPGGRDLARRNAGWLAAFGGFALAIAVTISSPAVFGKNALPLGDRLRDAVNFKGWTVKHRFALWRAAALMTRDAPVLGNGPEHFRTRFPLVQARFRAAQAKAGFHFAPKEFRAHNDYLQLAAEQGLVGLGLWLWIGAVVRRLGLAATGGRGGVEAAGLQRTTRFVVLR